MTHIGCLDLSAYPSSSATFCSAPTPPRELHKHRIRLADAFSPPTAPAQRISAMKTFSFPFLLNTFCCAPRPPCTLHKHKIHLTDACSSTHSPRAAHISHEDLQPPLPPRHLPLRPRPPCALHSITYASLIPVAQLTAHTWHIPAI